ncbi:hypothetical protein [Lysobacter gummosus]|uniref:hypothetical protein n=1 Tax=Lysobacter gummosus TaxID=262324 RepID=UPI003643D9D2
MENHTLIRKLSSARKPPDRGSASAARRGKPWCGLRPPERMAYWACPEPAQSTWLSGHYLCTPKR